MTESYICFLSFNSICLLSYPVTTWILKRNYNAISFISKVFIFHLSLEHIFFLSCICFTPSWLRQVIWRISDPYFVLTTLLDHIFSSSSTSFLCQFVEVIRLEKVLIAASGCSTFSCSFGQYYIKFLDNYTSGLGSKKFLMFF